MNRLTQAAQSTLNTCMGLQPEETLLLIYDRDSPLAVVKSLFNQAEKLGSEVLKTEILPRQLDGEEPPAAVAALMKEVDVILAPTSKSLSHTEARRAASRAGVRIATLPGITEDIFIRGMQADYQEIKIRGNGLVALLNEATNAHLTSPSGTDLKLLLGNEFMNDNGIYHQRGDFGNLPAGEVCGAPTEGKTEGTLVIDHMGDLINQPTTLIIKEGTIVDIQKNPSGKKLQHQLELAAQKDGNRNAYQIAELGIGLNKNARLRGNVLEDEKVYQTIHVACGDNTSYDGGTNPASLHLDGIIENPSLVIDESEIIVNGEHLV